MSLGQMLIDLGPLLFPADFLLGQLANLLRWCSGEQRGWWNHRAILDEGRRTDDRVLPDLDVIHQHRIDTDQGIATDAAAMQHRPMADMSVLLDGHVLAGE